MFKHTFSTKDLFSNLKSNIIKDKWIKNNYKDYKNFATEVFTKCFYEILLDIINNNITFVLPLKFGNYAEIYMKQFSDEDFKKLYKKGKFNNIDFIQSQFTGNQITYKYNNKHVKNKEKSIYVNKDLNQLIIDYTNKCKNYY